jgi:hypothetical protein
MVLTGIESPLKASFAYVAATADLLGLRDLHQRWSRVADRKEQLRVFGQAGSLMAPIHEVTLLVEVRDVA